MMQDTIERNPPALYQQETQGFPIGILSYQRPGIPAMILIISTMWLLLMEGGWLQWIIYSWRLHIGKLHQWHPAAFSEAASRAQQLWTQPTQVCHSKSDCMHLLPTATLLMRWMQGVKSLMEWIKKGEVREVLPSPPHTKKKYLKSLDLTQF